MIWLNPENPILVGFGRLQTIYQIDLPIKDWQIGNSIKQMGIISGILLWDEEKKSLLEDDALDTIHVNEGKINALQS